MAGPADEAAREAAHEPSGAPDWEEAWDVELSGPDGLWGFVRLAVRPGARVASYWASMVVPDVGLVLVRDDDVAMPRVRTGARVDLEVRADGLWAELVCETPMEHWGFRLEAFGVRLDDPLDARVGEWGERLPVGLDLEWETAARSASPDLGLGRNEPACLRYAHTGVVHGELLFGHERLAVVGPAAREHTWGASPLVPGAWRVTGCGTNDAVYAFAVPGALPVATSWAEARAADVTTARFESTFDAAGVPERGELEIDGRRAVERRVGVTVTSAVPVVLDATRVLWRTRCALSGPWDGEGWVHWVDSGLRSST